MDRVTLRLPADVKRAYDDAPANRSKLMRHYLQRAVADGELDVPERYEKLAEAQEAKEGARWDVKDAGLRGRAYHFTQKRWKEGTHPPDAMDRAIEGFREEADNSDDPDARAYVENMITWYREMWPRHDPTNRREFPDAAEFHTNPEAADDGLVQEASELIGPDGQGRKEATRQLANEVGYSEAAAAVRKATEETNG